MTKKDFIRFAAIFKNNDFARKEVLHETSFYLDIVEYFEEVNPRFNRERFKAAVLS